MKKIIPLVALFTSGFWLTSLGQSIQKDLIIEEKSNLRIGIDYSSNYNAFGLFENFTAQPNSSASVNYFGKRGLALSVSGLLISNNNTATKSKGSQEVDLAGGWNFGIWDNAVLINPSISHFFYSASAATAKSLFTDQTELEILGSFRWFKPSFTADYLFGKSKALNINLMLGFETKFENLFGKGNNLQFTPGLGTNYGDLSYSMFFSKNLFQYLLPLRTRYGDNITIQQLETNGAIPKLKAVDKQLSYLNPTATLGQIFETTNSYRINSIDLMLPLVYYLKNLSINSSVNVVKPMNVPGYIQSKTVFYFSAGVSYSFNL
ncbi:MAG: hypothetical protein NTZ69_10185 [Bacteroidia bacterium]|nr:hypothetical protein [Bacteroidia bacterium]